MTSKSLHNVINLKQYYQERVYIRIVKNPKRLTEEYICDQGRKI